ncbi:HDIG domain-containing protein [candidate division KSB1 bacterium]|nr:HDIG domain-containing protein [candidate division KSB1 bacterium]
MFKLPKFVLSIQDSIQNRLAQLEKHKFWRYTPQMLMGISIVVVTTLMFPQSQSFQFSHLKEGDVSSKEIIAPFTFFVDKSEEELERDKQRATEKVPLAFVRKDSIAETEIKNLKAFFQRIVAIRASVSPDSIKRRRLIDVLNDYSIIIDQENRPFLLKDGMAKKTTESESKEVRFNYEELKRNLTRILVDTYTIGILDVSLSDIPEYVNKISVVTDEQETLHDLNDYYNQDNVETVILEDKLRRTYPEQEMAVKIGYAIIISFLQPNVLYDIEETNKRIQEAVAKVPLAKGTVLAKERIVDRHERITTEILDKLRSLAKRKSEREQREGGMKLVFPYLGQLLMVSLSLSFAVIFLFFSRREIFDNTKKMLMIFCIFIIIITFTFLVNQIGFSKYKFLIPIAIASMLLTIFFDTRMAFIGTVALSILIGAVRGNEFAIMFVSLFVGTISIFTVREIQARSWILKGILFISGAYVLAIGALELLRGQELMIREGFLYGIINGVLSPILTYGLMIIFEFSFKMTTDSTLLELSDLNKPLLRELAIRAPGTYHHSIMVGNLSEAAAEAIGANALLTRAGSYYHDIGKMEMPEYFVENQKGGKNPHEKLTPTMSCLILINHVKRGLEIAEEYNLPKEIRDFIPQHHGTNLISFFYKKALENSNGVDINESDFRYQGPRPQTKETGIVMLADAVEAVSRTLKEPTVSRIRSLVNSFIQERLAGSELDECPLTIKDLHQIRESFVNNLTGIYHGRIEYPDRDKKFLRRI